MDTEPPQRPYIDAQQSLHQEPAPADLLSHRIIGTAQESPFARLTYRSPTGSLESCTILSSSRHPVIDTSALYRCYAELCRLGGCELLTVELVSSFSLSI